MTTKEFIIANIYNVIVILIFGALAVFFNHWWILLLSILFCTFPKVVWRHYRVCDNCGKKSRIADSEEEAINKAEKDGWLHMKTTNKDFCPDCLSPKESYNENN